MTHLHVYMYMYIYNIHTRKFVYIQNSRNHTCTILHVHVHVHASLPTLTIKPCETWKRVYFLYHSKVLEFLSSCFMHTTHDMYLTLHYYYIPHHNFYFLLFMYCTCTLRLPTLSIMKVTNYTLLISPFYPLYMYTQYR